MLKKIRQLHFYLGVLFAPAIVFFSITGAFQTFRWQENGAAGAATPTLAKLAAIHKDQSLSHAEGPPKGRPPEAQAQADAQPGAGPRSEPSRQPPEGEGAGESRGPSPLPLKIYVLLMSLGLITSTATGVYMAFKYNRDKRIVWGLLILGTLMPLILLYL